LRVHNTFSKIIEAHIAAKRQAAGAPPMAGGWQARHPHGQKSMTIIRAVSTAIGGRALN
jgi:hypothetical protein